jgi:hypothetical protein
MLGDSAFITTVGRSVEGRLAHVHDFMNNVVDSVGSSLTSSPFITSLDSTTISQILDLVLHLYKSSLISDTRHKSAPPGYYFTNSKGGVNSLYCGGSLWSGYSAPADFLNNASGVEVNAPCLQLMRSCGYYWCLKDYAILTERPSVLSVRSGALHNDSGMAIKYPSGWGAYFLNGIQVSSKSKSTA